MTVESVAIALTDLVQPAQFRYQITEKAACQTHINRPVPKSSTRAQ